MDRLTRWYFDQSRAGERNPYILSLSTVDGICRDGIPKQLAVRAATRLAPDAIVALLARRVKRHDDLVADREVRDRVTFLDDPAHEFVAANEARFDLEVTAVKVQIGSLDGEQVRIRETSRRKT